MNQSSGLIAISLSALLVLKAADPTRTLTRPRISTVLCNAHSMPNSHLLALLLMSCTSTPLMHRSHTMKMFKMAQRNEST